MKYDFLSFHQILCPGKAYHASPDCWSPATCCTASSTCSGSPPSTYSATTSYSSTTNYKSGYLLKKLNIFYLGVSAVAAAPSEADRARIDRERQRQREQDRRRREAQVHIEFHHLILTPCCLIFQQNQIDMNRQSDMMAAFEENII